MSRIHKNKNGLTLIELMAALMLVSFILGAVWVVYNVSFKTFSGQLTRGGITSEAERALFEFGSDMRQAVSITAASAASLTFTADTNSDGLNETIQYTWGGTPGNPFNKKVATVTRPVVHSVSNLAFSYYGSNNNLLSSPVDATKVRLVMITMTVANGDESFTINAAAKLRCL